MQNQWQVTQYCAKCGSTLVADANFKKCSNCGKHFYFNARPCVAIWLTNAEGEVLLTKRARDPFKDWWDIPGGFVEEGETLEDAIRRELKEETGLEAGTLTYLGSLYEDYHYGGEVVPVVAAVFKSVIKSTAPVIVADDVSDYKFVAVTEIDFDHIAFDNQRTFLKKIQK